MSKLPFCSNEHENAVLAEAAYIVTLARILSIKERNKCEIS